ncbi:competence/damage-inducible protein A [Halobacteriales archaeon QS_3_64_16]|nr:MAG: competence/damage-inducible protein A [Halobacteriales archaeon QS_3_64_16]
MQVAIVTVGDEILAGETVNTNAAWLGERLTERGVTVSRVVTLPDRVDALAHTINEYRAAYDAVLVTGGLGPTHDDLTMEGVAAAVGRDLEASEDALAWLEDHGGYAAEDLAAGTVHLPAGARVLHNEAGVAPGCVIESVYVLPGVPEEMQAMFERIEEEFAGEPRYVESIVTTEPESALLDRFEGVQEAFDVKIGSYPGENVRIRVESDEEREVENAIAWLRERVDLADG